MGRTEITEVRILCLQIQQYTKITSTDINTLIEECNNKLSLSCGIFYAFKNFKHFSTIALGNTE